MRLSNRAKFRGEIWVFGNQPTDRRQPLLDEMSAAFPTTVTVSVKALTSLLFVRDTMAGT